MTSQSGLRVSCGDHVIVIGIVGDDVRHTGRRIPKAEIEPPKNEVEVARLDLL